MIPPLNGSRTHPLSEHAIRALQSLSHAPRPTQEFNAGVINRLLREALVTIEDVPSPYATGRGKRIPFATITAAGHAALKEHSKP